MVGTGRAQAADLSKGRRAETRCVLGLVDAQGSRSIGWLAGKVGPQRTQKGFLCQVESKLYLVQSRDFSKIFEQSQVTHSDFSSRI